MSLILTTILSSGAVKAAQVATKTIIRGNSIGNQINSGKVAYMGNYIYFSNPQDSGKLYKCNIDGTHKIKLSDDIASNISIYKDSIFYLKQNNGPYEIYKINNNGTSKKLFVKDKVDDNFQIVNGYAYYAVFKPINPAMRTPFYYPKDVYKVSLATNKKTPLGTTCAYRIYIKDDGWAYCNDRYTLFKANINNFSKQTDITYNLWNANIEAINDSNIFYTSLHVPYKSSKDIFGLCKAKFSPSSIYTLSEATASVYFATNNNLYEVIDKNLYVTKINSTDKKLLKKLDIIEKDRTINLYMVNDKLCYFNSKGEIILVKV